MTDAGVTRMPAMDATGRPAAEPSPRSYATAVVLSSVLGFAGVQHFYLGRVAEGLLDIGLTLGWLYGFATGQLLVGFAFLGLDMAHALTVTILLLTGNFRDGAGRVVCYPG
ncbi:MAG: TM2 domain-containing protein, partial [Deltaproteobacteria bacterium]